MGFKSATLPLALREIGAAHGCVLRDYSVLGLHFVAWSTQHVFP